MNTRGFTLVEMIIVVGVIGVLAMIIVLQFNGTNKNFSLQNAESLVRSDIRRMMTYATTGKTCCAGDATPTGYGFIATPGSTTYQVYADVDGDKQYTASSTDEILELIDAQTGDVIIGATPSSDIEIQTCSPAATPGGPCDLFVEVPAGDMYANGITASTFTVTLRQTQNLQTAIVTVDLNSGQIE